MYIENSIVILWKVLVLIQEVLQDELLFFDVKDSYPITSLGLEPSAGPTIPIDSSISTTRAARP